MTTTAPPTPPRQPGVALVAFPLALLWEPDAVKRVWLALQRHVDALTATCWPSIRRLQSETRLGRSTVLGALKRLRELGVVEAQHRVREGTAGQQTSNLWRLRYDRLAEHPDMAAIVDALGWVQRGVQSAGPPPSSQLDPRGSSQLDPEVNAGGRDRIEAHPLPPAPDTASCTPSGGAAGGEGGPLPSAWWIVDAYVDRCVPWGMTAPPMTEDGLVWSRPVLDLVHRRQLQLRWSEEQWELYLAHAARCPLLLPGTGTWVASLPWLVSKAGMERVLAGQYGPVPDGLCA